MKPVVTTAVYQRLDWSRHIKKIIKTWRTRTHSSANGRAGFAHTGVHDKGGGFMYVKFSPAAAADGAGPGRQGTLKNFGHKKNKKKLVPRFQAGRTHTPCMCGQVPVTWRRSPSSHQDESSSQGLSLNGSQHGNCSTEYDTPAGT